MSTDGERAAWVERVLGFKVGAGISGAPGGGSPKFIELWRGAKEQVDGGIATLQDRMRKHPLPALRRIADGGLNGVTDKASVGMMVAMMEADNAKPQPAAKAVAAMRSFLASDVAAAIDENPFKIAVGLRATLGGALDQIERRLSA